jgi:hypothetical protein
VERKANSQVDIGLHLIAVQSMITLDLLQEKNWKNFFEQTNIKKSA